MGGAGAGAASNPTTNRLVDWASAFVPTLRERSARCEEERHILPETIRDFVDAGIVRICQPVEFGGFGLGLDVVAEVAMTAACLVPKSDFRIDDDWYVSGLRGTGSKSFVIDDAFVPEHRMVPMEAMFGTGWTPGSKLYRDPCYQGIPYVLWAAPLLASAVIGMAQGVVDLFEDRVQRRISPHTMGPAREQPGNQLRFAESTAEVDAPRLILRNVFRELRAWGVSGREIPLVERAGSRRDTTYAVRLCVQAADRLHESGDASAMYESNPSQRLVRDIHAGALQVSLTWDEPAIQYSRVRWGLPPQTRMI
jgi:3-hydroxy-9,10-secoandrosta-1,3,5(10)-triene-9,17-dione monooxygenase